jgi:hypothetical protein
MLVVYRYSDAGHVPASSGWDITKEDCFFSFYKRFKHHKLVFICDNCSEESVNSFKKLNNGHVYETNDGAHAGLLNSLERILNDYPDEDSYYFAEDDYLYSADDPYKLLTEGLTKADYCTLYDHPDKYPDYHYAPNPLLREDGERSLVYRTDSIHWKTTNSLCYTFAVKRVTLLNDISVFKQHVLDFPTFTALLAQGRVIASCLPGQATHVASGPGVKGISEAKQYESPFFKHEMSN